MSMTRWKQLGVPDRDQAESLAVLIDAGDISRMHS